MLGIKLTFSLKVKDQTYSLPKKKKKTNMPSIDDKRISLNSLFYQI